MLLNKKGMTLTELLVASSILLIVMIPISMMLYSGYTTFNVESSTMDAQQSAQKALDSILTDLRKYEFANASYTPDGLLIAMAQANTLTIIEDDGNNNLYYSYNSGEKKIYRYYKDNSGQQNSTFENITAFTVSETLGSNRAVIDISISAKVGTGREIKLNAAYSRKAYLEA